MRGCAYRLFRVDVAASAALVSALLVLLCSSVASPAYAANKTAVAPVAPAAPVNPAGNAAAKVLLVDDDESDNNNIPGDKRLSSSDTFYRKLLQAQALPFDALVVGRYAHGPGIEQLRAYSLIVWYTGASYGGNRDNTAVISVKDEESLRRYLEETGGTVIVFSPGYLNNALGAGGAALWAKKESSFLQDVIGVRGGRGLLQRFKEGSVVAPDGASFAVTKKQAVEAQFSVLNPAGAEVVFSSLLDPDGSGPRSVAVATSHAVGKGRMVYIGFTFENLATDANAAFAQLLPAATAQSAAAPAPAPAATEFPRRARTDGMTVSGIGRLSDGAPFVPRNVGTESMNVTGVGRVTDGAPFVARRISTEAMKVTGTRSLR